MSWQIFQNIVLTLLVPPLPWHFSPWPYSRDLIHTRSSHNIKYESCTSKHPIFDAHSTHYKGEAVAYSSKCDLRQNVASYAAICIKFSLSPSAMCVKAEKSYTKTCNKKGETNSRIRTKATFRRGRFVHYGTSLHLYFGANHTLKMAKLLHTAASAMCVKTSTSQITICNKRL